MRRVIDLSILKNHWTLDGAREVFAQLVTQCVRSNHPGARAIRPDPGDEGVDTFFGEFNKDVRVWQAKYFPDGIGESQQKQIRDSWKTCRTSSIANRMTLWTLCVPCDLSIEEEKWWQKWKAAEQKKTKIQIELWTKPTFTSFSRRSDLTAVFSFALNKQSQHATAAQVVSAMKTAVARPIKKLAGARDKELLQAVFVRKLEAAGIAKHRSARAAFYNFELVRKSIEVGGTPEELEALEDLQERTYALWEGMFNARRAEALGREFYAAVDAHMDAKDKSDLDSLLELHVIHKKGGLHHWADVCEVGWTAGHSQMIEEEERAAIAEASEVVEA